MTPFIFADTEDNSAELLKAGKSGFDKKVTQIAALISDDSDRFYSRGDTSKFLHWLQSRPEKIVYFHNTQYDLGNLFGNNFGRVLSFRLVGSRFIMARGYGKLWLDSFNIWPMALKKVGLKFGLKKIETSSMAHDEKYVWRDCEIGRAAMLFAMEFAERYCVPKLPSTLGGFSVAVFRAMGLHNLHDGNLFARAGLYGGRVELFSMGGEGDILYTDINSLYPFAMLGEFPKDAQPQSQMRGFGVCHATVYVPPCDVAPLPVRRNDGAIYFPCGKFSGVWTYHELRAAEQRGAKILSVKKCYGSRTGEDFYAPFVQRLWKERAKTEPDGPENLMLKLLCNNLYGRLAIRGEILGNVKGSSRLRTYQIPLPEFTNYLHAAYVTSYGRIILADHLRRVPPDNLIYTDTDSVIFFNRGRQPPFPIGGDLGEMKLVARGRECATFAPKMYTFDDFAKAKGVPQRYAAQFIEKGFAVVEQPYKIREVCNFMERRRGERKKLSVWRKVKKVRRSTYDKKTLQRDRYYPIILGSRKARHRRKNKHGKRKRVK